MTKKLNGLVMGGSPRRGWGLLVVLCFGSLVFFLSQGTYWISGNKMMKTPWFKEKSSHDVPSYLNRWNNPVSSTVGDKLVIKSPSKLVPDLASKQTPPLKKSQTSDGKTPMSTAVRVSRSPFSFKINKQANENSTLKSNNKTVKSSFLEKPKRPEATTLSNTADKLFSTAVYVKQFKFTLAKEFKDRFSVGDLVHVDFSAKDGRNNMVSNTGDFFRASIITSESKSGAVGMVTDHQNGTYTVTFRLLWEGRETIKIQLVLPRQTIDVVERNRREDPFEMVTFQRRFTVGKKNVDMQCNVDPVIFKDSPVCNYSDPHAGVWWYCVKPVNASCNTSGSQSRLRYKKTKLRAGEEKLFNRGNHAWKMTIPGSPANLNVTRGRDPLANRSRCVRGLRTPHISGFYQDGVWNSLVCKNRHFASKKAWQQCLAGKTLHFIGDSTLRQCWEHLVRILEINETRFPGVTHNPGPLLANDSLNNITVKFQIHGPPLRFGWTREIHIKYLANSLDEISGGPNDVVGITIWAHFTSFPVNVYRDRIKAVRAAIVRLLERSPQTLVVIKSANTNTGNMLFEGDWLAQRLDAMMRETFIGLEVVLVDAWEMTNAQHWHTDNLNPAVDIIVQELEFLCSFICPL